MVTNINNILNPLPCYNVPINFIKNKYANPKEFICSKIYISIKSILNLALISIEQKCLHYHDLSLRLLALFFQIQIDFVKSFNLVSSIDNCEDPLFYK